MYEAIITPIVNFQPIPKADFIVQATAANTTVIVSKSTEEGALGVLFPEGGQLSHEFCYHNNLYRDSEKNKDTSKSGFFEDSRRVRAQPFRGVKSEGFWVPLSYFDWTGANLNKLKPGTSLTKVGGYTICQKYFSPATLRMMKQQGKAAAKKKLKTKERYKLLKEHFDTKQLRHYLTSIPEKSLITITVKAHGTSARTGHIPALTEKSELVPKLAKINKRKKWSPNQIRRRIRNFFLYSTYAFLNCFIRFSNKWKQWWNKRMQWTGLSYKTFNWQYVSGTRKVILDPDATEESGFYSGKTFRIDIHNSFKDLNLPKGLCIYYEIVGYAEDGSQIMPSHDIKDKKLKKLYGPKMTYKYGTTPNGVEDTKQYRILVYRMSMINEDGYETELSWNEVKKTCDKLGLEYVVELESFIYDGNTEALFTKASSLTEGPDPLDHSHIREGVCVRIDNQYGTNILKAKSYEFTSLEGISTQIDPEAVETYMEDSPQLET